MMAEHLHSSFIPGCFRCAIGLDEVEADARISILRKDLESLIAALEDRERLQRELDTCSAWLKHDIDGLGTPEEARAALDAALKDHKRLRKQLEDCQKTVRALVGEGRDG